MDVRVSMGFVETLTVRFYEFDLSAPFRDVVISSRPTSPTEISADLLVRLCELARQGSRGQFMRVDLRTNGLTCFVAGRSNDFTAVDYHVAGVIASILDTTVQIRHVATSDAG